MPNKLLEKLWELAQQEAQRTGTSFEMVFDPIGLRLERPLTTWTYSSTPLNSSTFASTGGDGVSFGLVHIYGEISDNSPVVMTAPMAFSQPNTIVGSHLSEFLSLGCQVGYLALEELAYDLENAISWLKHPDQWFAKCYDGPLEAHLVEVQSLLQLLREKFSLEPWEKIEERLAELQLKFMPSLRLPEVWRSTS
ncbi:MAG: hypothetical protein HYX86_04970 [Chloroflexi bacterium]|nr:hypothetical protein [Chloroflexota bacterium]